MPNETQKVLKRFGISISQTSKISVNIVISDNGSETKAEQLLKETNTHIKQIGKHEKGTANPNQKNKMKKKQAIQ